MSINHNSEWGAYSKSRHGFIGRPKSCAEIATNSNLPCAGDHSIYLLIMKLPYIVRHLHCLSSYFSSSCWWHDEGNKFQLQAQSMHIPAIESLMSYRHRSPINPAHRPSPRTIQEPTIQGGNPPIIIIRTNTETKNESSDE